MDYDGRFIMQKTVDWSLLNDGMTIPVSACALPKAWDESILTHGVGKDIKVLVDGEFYDAKLKNQNFEQSNWAGHKDVIQIRYGRQSALAVKLRAVFKKSYDYLFAQKQLLGKSKRQILLPDDIHEYIRLYLTTSPVRRTMTPRISLSSVPITTASFTRTIRTSTARSFSSNSRMVRR